MRKHQRVQTINSEVTSTPSDERSRSRRAWLKRSAQGFGWLAFQALLADQMAPRGTAAESATGARPGPLAPRPPHYAPKAKSVIFLYMDGGPSQVDTFDFKPQLERYSGKDPHHLFKVEPTQFNNVGTVLPSPWKFRQHGQSGRWVSELFPYLAKVVDDLAFIRSMVVEFPEHTNANYFLHTGSGLQGRPSVGAWFSYGLGSENQNLPGFVVLNGGLIPPGGLDNFNSGFLPAAYQGSIFKPANPPLANVAPLERDARLQQNKLALMRQLDRIGLDRVGYNDDMESALANYELAFRMQAAVPELMELKGETQATKALYGLDAAFPQTRTFAMQCLLARRLVERGVRFVELTCPGIGGLDRWDAHANLHSNHTQNCLAVDQPIAGLLQDLKSRGMLRDTLVVWAGEFGRTPFAQGSNGRDHNPFGFTLWLAGGGIRGGAIHGETDDFGYKAIAGKVNIHDFHATLLHLLGIDHTRLTYRYSGRDIRLTDVYGNVVKEILV